MGKVLTALGVMTAVDDGLLYLDAPIRAAIPDLSLLGADSERLTLRSPIAAVGSPRLHRIAWTER